MEVETTPDEKSQRKRELKVSFHLEQLLGKTFKLPNNVGSVDFLLTSPFDQSSEGTNIKSSRLALDPSAGNLAGVTLKVWVDMLNIQNEGNLLEWDSKILVVTSKRLFIINRTTFNCFEIGDSIPIQEIQSVDIVKDIFRRDRSNLCRLSRLCNLWKPGTPPRTNFNCSSDALYAGHNADCETSKRALTDKYEALLLNAGATKMCLRITTAPGGFNDGQPYYFKLSRFSHPRRVSGPPLTGCNIFPSKSSVCIVVNEIRRLSHALHTAAAQPASAAAAADRRRSSSAEARTALKSLWEWARS
jgi:hypothetical protein